MDVPPCKVNKVSEFDKTEMDKLITTFRQFDEKKPATTEKAPKWHSYCSKLDISQSKLRSIAPAPKKPSLKYLCSGPTASFLCSRVNKINKYLLSLRLANDPKLEGFQNKIFTEAHLYILNLRFEVCIIKNPELLPKGRMSSVNFVEQRFYLVNNQIGEYLLEAGAEEKHLIAKMRTEMEKLNLILAARYPALEVQKFIGYTFLKELCFEYY